MRSYGQRDTSKPARQRKLSARLNETEVIKRAEKRLRRKYQLK